MGKQRNRHNRQSGQNFPGVSMTPAPVPEEGASEQTAEDTAEEQYPSVEEVVAQAMETPVAEEAPAQEAEAPEEPEPAPAEIKYYKEPKRKVMSEDLFPTKLSPMQKCVMTPQQLHTPPGLKLLDMFKEYEAAMSVRTTDRKEHAKRARMLSAIVQQTCPYKLKNTQIGKDLVMIFFDQLMKGWGKIYTDSTMFRLDYSLGQPAVIDKMDIFCQAMIQLVEAATGESDHIAFQSDRLAQVIDSPAVMTAIENLRAGIEKRILQQKR